MPTRRPSEAPFARCLRTPILIAAAAVLTLPALLPPSAPLVAQEARSRWERMAQIRRDKFDLVLPEAMRENDIDMWITVVREGLPDPLTEDLGGGYVGSTGYYVFTDRGGDRIERVAIGVSGYRLTRSGAYDQILGGTDLREFVAERNPERIGVNMSEQIGGADGLSHSSYLHLVETLGEPWASRIVSAEKLVSDFRSRRVATEIAAFAEAGEISKEIAERALSNEVIVPGVTALEDVAWWIMDRLLERGLGTSFDFPSIYITGPTGIEATSNERIIQRGDLMMIDWGVTYLNFATDMKRVAYVLREGESEAPASFVHAYERGLEARSVIRRTIRAGRTAQANSDAIRDALSAARFRPMEVFNQPYDTPTTDIMWGNHSVGNLGHGIGPSIAFFNPLRLTFEVRPTNLLSIELFAYTPVPEWDGAKVRIPLEDDAVVTERGVEWLYPPAERILLVR